MLMEECPCEGTICGHDRLVRTLLGLNIRYCLFAVVLLSLILFASVSIYMTAAGHNGSQEDLEAVHVNANVMGAVFNQSNVPPTEPPILLLLLIHASGSFEGRLRRDAIRSTWLSDVDLISQKIGQPIKYRFVLGGKNLSPESEYNLTSEAEVHRDLIILVNVTDAHGTLTHRTLQSFEYIVKHNYNFLYILKCDDDTFVNLKVIAEELKDRNTSEPFYWGEFLGASNILTEGPYAEHKWSSCETYLPYAFGGGYVLSRDLIELIASNAPFLMKYENEDVSLGAWLALYNVNYHFDSRFNTGGVSRGCKKQFVVMHKVTVDQMYSYFEAVKEEGYICTKKNRWFGWHGHVYNWNTLPSKCCKRRRRIP